MSATTTVATRPRLRPRSRQRRAFTAVLGRDLYVTWKELPSSWPR